MNEPPILLVEDCVDDVYLLRRAFESAAIAHPVQVASDGQQAMDYLAGKGNFAERRQYPLPQLVLLDLKLPVKTGLEVLSWVRQQPPLKGLIVIMLSSSVYNADIQRAYFLGANAFLVKPSNPHQLVAMCKALKDFWLTFNLPPAAPA